MINVDECAGSLDRLIHEETTQLGEKTLYDEGVAMQLGGTLLTHRGKGILEVIVAAFEADPAIRANRISDDIASKVQECVARTAEIHRSSGAFDARNVIEDLYQQLTSALPWRQFYVPFEGLVIPDGRSIELSGLTLGPLTEEEWVRLATDMRTKFLLPSPDMQTLPMTQALTTQHCWARLTLCAGDKTALGIVKESMQNATALLRTFFHSQPSAFDVDRSRVGEAYVHGQDISYSYGQDINTGKYDTFTIHASVRDTRFPYELGAEQLDSLLAHPLFQRAQRIAATAFLTEVESKILYAMRQYSAASILSTPEVKLQNYLTVVEMLFARDDEVVDRTDNATKRLSLAVTDENQNTQPGSTERRTAREDYRVALRKTYEVRAIPVHRGQRRLTKADAATLDNALNVARVCAYQSIMLALLAEPSITDHADFIQELDQRLSANNPNLRDKRKYQAMVFQDQSSGKFHATMPDLDCTREGPTERQAISALQKAAARVLKARASEGKGPPSATAKSHGLWIKLTPLPLAPPER